MITHAPDSQLLPTIDFFVKMHTNAKTRDLGCPRAREFVVTKRRWWCTSLKWTPRSACLDNRHVSSDPDIYIEAIRGWQNSRVFGTDNVANVYFTLSSLATSTATSWSIDPRVEVRSRHWSLSFISLDLTSSRWIRPCTRCMSSSAATRSR